MKKPKLDIVHFWYSDYDLYGVGIVRITKSNEHEYLKEDMKTWMPRKEFQEITNAALKNGGDDLEILRKTMAKHLHMVGKFELVFPDSVKHDKEKLKVIREDYFRHMGLV